MTEPSTSTACQVCSFYMFYWLLGKVMWKNVAEINWAYVWP